WWGGGLAPSDDMAGSSAQECSRVPTPTLFGVYGCGIRDGARIWHPRRRRWR
ncbi:unnamed protein product, partial [Urochloa humidicola]